MNYLVKTRSILNKMDKYPKLLKWDLSPSVSAKINDCLNSDEAYKVILKFSKETNKTEYLEQLPKELLRNSLVIYSILPNGYLTVAL